MPSPQRIDIKNIELFGKQLSTLKQDFFDAIHPIGETYTQYPQQDDPMTLYNRNGIQSVWEEQLQYNGAFFRSSNALTVVWKADGESNYYSIDSTNKITPVKVKADKGGGINIASSTSGHTKNIGGKIYKDYAVTGYSTSAASYINKTDNLNIQSNQNAYHRHSMEHTHSLSDHTHTINHGHGNTIAVNTASFSGTAVDTDEKGKGSIDRINYNNSSNPTYSGVLSYTAQPYDSQVGSTGGSSTGKMKLEIANHKHSVTAKGTVSVTLKGGVTDHSGSSGTPSNNTSGAASNSNTTYNGSSTDTESRPNNYSYIIWKRIA